MADLFISYKAEDRARVRPLVEALQADGLDVWWDAHIGAGVDWRETIASNLDGASCVVVVWSKRSVGPEGRFVRDEAARAVKRDAYLPVTIDKVDPPLGFGETQCLPLVGWKGNREDPRYLALLDAARQVCADEPAARGPIAAMASGAVGGGGVDRRFVLGGGVLASAAVAGGVGWWFLRGTPAKADSVAVMPFANLSGDPEQAYFSDGMAEELRSALSRIEGLKVIGRTSSELLRDDDATTVASQLGVASIVTGSVRRSASTIRVAAQLVDGATGIEQWSESFDRPNGDALAIQTNIAEAVAAQLRTRLGAGDRAALAIGGTANAAAQDLFLKADAAYDGSEEGFKTQIALLDAAIALDPVYAAALAGRGWAESAMVAFYGRTQEELAAGIDSGAEFARQAIAAAPGFADAHYAMGYNRRVAIDFGAAWAEYRKALDSPGCPPDTILRILSMVSSLGDEDKALDLWQAASNLDPLNPALKASRGGIAITARRYEEGIRLARDFLQETPDSPDTRSGLAVACVFTGQFEAALREAALLPDAYPSHFIVRAVVANRTGDPAGALAVLDEMRQEYGDNAHYQYAQIRAELGRADMAIDELEAAIRFRDPGLGGLPTDALFDKLRDDPRFDAIVERLDFPRF